MANHAALDAPCGCPRAVPLEGPPEWLEPCTAHGAAYLAVPPLIRRVEASTGPGSLVVEDLPATFISPAGAELAEAIHGRYEELAPLYGFRHRTATGKPWDEVGVEARIVLLRTAQSILDSWLVIPGPGAPPDRPDDDFLPADPESDSETERCEDCGDTIGPDDHKCPNPGCVSHATYRATQTGLTGGRSQPCEACQAPILWRRHVGTGKVAPLDAVATPTGNLALVAPDGYLVLGDDDQPADGNRYVSHFTVCPEADSFRRSR